MTQIESVKSQFVRLDTYRRNVRTLLERIASLGGIMHAPTAITNELAADRKVIRDIKFALFNHGIPFIKYQSDDDELGYGGALLLLEQQLQDIDFESQINTCKQICEALDQQGGAALFVIQNSLGMEGGLFSARLQQIVRERRLLEDVFVKSVNFLLENPANKHDFLDKVSIIPYPQVEEDFVTKLVNTTQQLYAYLRDKSVFYLDIYIRDTIALDDQFFVWFMQDFWVPLSDSIFHNNTNSLSMPLSFITLVRCDGLMPAACMAHILRSKAESANRHTLELGLTPWSANDINRWLQRNHRFVYPPHGLKPSERESRATALWHTSEQGMPLKVYRSLIQEFKAHCE